MKNGDFPIGLAIIIAAATLGLFFVWAVIIGLVLVGAF
jgi:hypothetical protein